MKTAHLIEPGQPGPNVIYLPAQNMMEAAYNPRQLTTKQAWHLLESLLLFGFVDPVIINQHPDRAHVLVGGHQRRRLTMQAFTQGVEYLDGEGNAKLYPVGHALEGQPMVHGPGFVIEGCRLTDPGGLLMIPATPVCLNLEREKELNLRLNQNGGEWDKDVLANHYSPEELLGIGFSNYELGILDIEPATIDGHGSQDGEGSGSAPAKPNNSPPTLTIVFTTPEDAQAVHNDIQELIDRLCAQPTTVKVSGMGADNPPAPDDEEEEEEEEASEAGGDYDSQGL